MVLLRYFYKWICAVLLFSFKEKEKMKNRQISTSSDASLSLSLSLSRSLARTHSHSRAHTLSLALALHPVCTQPSFHDAGGAAQLFMQAEAENQDLDFGGFEENMTEAIDCYHLVSHISIASFCLPGR